MKGTVFLVGAGPGDPGLLTLRAAELLRRADVVLYDALVSDGILRLARPDARMIPVGRRGAELIPGSRTPYNLPGDVWGVAGCRGGLLAARSAQRLVERLLVREARRSRVVVRLKGGDPFIYGRGGEEAEALAAARIPFEVVPGVTAGIAAAAYAGIPLTHRNYGSTVTFMTGHDANVGAGDPLARVPRTRPSGPPLDVEAVARADTVVVYMGVGNLPALAKRMMEAGKSANTPAALIQDGTRPGQRTVTGTLGTIATRAKAAGVKPPALLVVGDVVRLRKHLNWFERRPLHGRRIAVTRDAGINSGAGASSPGVPWPGGRLGTLLADAGADVIACPTIRIAPPESWKPLDRALGHLSGFDWIVFASANGVDAVMERLAVLGKDMRSLGSARLAAIGPGTADRLAALRLKVDLQPKSFTSEGLLEAFRHTHVRGAWIFLPRAVEGRDVLPKGLRALGAKVLEVPAYRTLPASPGDAKAWRRKLLRGEMDAVTFTSASTVNNFVKWLGVAFLKRAGATLHGRPSVVWASLGPATSQALRAAGLRPSVEAKPSTFEGLATALQNYPPNSQGNAITVGARATRRIAACTAR